MSGTWTRRPYGRTDLSRERALLLGLDPYKIFSGQEAEENNFKTSTSFRLRMRNVFPEGEDHITSAGIYKPGDHAHEIADQDLFWTGSSGDPRNTSSTVQSGAWQGIAHNIAARSVINSLPFATDFNLGKGDAYYINGKLASNGAWYNRALQAILPTWRWIVDSSGSLLTPELWTGDSYQGGSCLRVSGTLDAANTLRLYLTSLPVTADTKIKIIYKRDGLSGVDSFMEAGVALASSPTSPIFYDVGNCDVDGWNESIIDLGSLAGSTISALSLRFQAPSTILDYEIRVGMISIYESSVPVPEAPSNVEKMDVTILPGSISGTIKWDPPASTAYSYNVYIRLSNGSLLFAGSTTNSYFYMEEMSLPHDYDSILVQTISPDMRKSPLSDENYPGITPTPSSNGNTIHLSWPSRAGAILEYRTKLATPPDWQELTGVNILDDNGNSSVEIPIDQEETQFFRLRW